MCGVRALWIGLVLAGTAFAQRPEVYVVEAYVAPGETNEGLWRPNAQEVATVREALRGYLKEAFLKDGPWREPKGQDKIRLNYDDYILQMQGVRKASGKYFFDTGGKGPKQIYVGGFCPSIHDLVSRNEESIVADGGSCVFHAIYDMDSARIIYFRMNGRA